MTLKYEGDKVSRVSGGGGNGGDSVGYLFKMFFGNDPSQWVRFVLLGIAIAAAFFIAIDFRDDMVYESKAARRSLNEYIAANEKWQALSSDERAVLIRRVDARIRRLYLHNGWEYQGITE